MLVIASVFWSSQLSVVVARQCPRFINILVTMDRVGACPIVFMEIITNIPKASLSIMASKVRLQSRIVMPKRLKDHQRDQRSNTASVTVRRLMSGLLVWD
jgi:hypothetical protein